MKTVLMLAAAFLSGAVGSMGLGGGAVLIIFLRLSGDTEQFSAQGVNLLFFIPVALAATVINTVRRRVDFSAVLPLCAGGAAGTVCGFFAAGAAGAETVARLFGGFIALLGAREIFFGVKTMLARNKNR